MAQQKFLDYTGLQRLVENIDKKYAPISAIVFKSSVEDLASLPALTDQKAGFMYNVKVGGITTSDFVEGAGHIVADGENVAAVELLTGAYTQVASPAATDDPKALGWYEVDTTTTYYAPVTPATGSENPNTEGWFEFTVTTPTADPAGEGLFEADGTHFVASTDTTIDAGKTYYAGALSADSSIQVGTTYYEEVTEVTYKLSTDRLPVSGKNYFTADTVKKWDLMGGVFDLEGRYLEFGETFPQGPAQRMIDGRTFLYMGDDQVVYEHVDTPTGRPVDNGYFEVTFTPVADPSEYFNPKQQDLYEEDSVTAGIYALSADTTVNNSKTYYTASAVPSTDPTVVVSKEYYTAEDQYKKAIIYQYDTTTSDWIAQSSGGAGDFIPITNNEIDDLFL